MDFKQWCARRVVFTLSMAIALTVAVSLIVAPTFPKARVHGAPALQEASSGRAASISGRAESRHAAIYRIPDLNEGETLFVYAGTTANNLDPTAYVLSGDVDVVAAGQQLREAARSASADGRDPVAALAMAADDVTLAWDDDSGEGYDAALTVTIPKDGDYYVAIGSNPVTDTFGDFRLLVGVDTPEVLENRLPSDSQPLEIALEQQSYVEAVQIITGTLTLDETETVHRLVDMRAGDTLTVFAEPLDGSLVPFLILEDFGAKATTADNLLGTRQTAMLSHTFRRDPTNYQLRIGAVQSGGALTSGTYRLVLGRNVPGAITGTATPGGSPILRASIPATISLRIDQITDVDQVAENFSVVGNALIEWHDPQFAFSPVECQCQQRLLRSDRVITDYLTRNNINEWPATYIYNQQGGRNQQTQLLTIKPDGSVTYFERFTATLQAPDFNFRQFPFDTQQFYVRIQSLFEEEYFTLIPDLSRSGFGPQLGEEEWIFSNDNFDASTITVNDRSQAVFAFTTHRHLSFYIFRIFVPVLLIILVSWVTFFLHDYNRRIEVSSGNLLLFIAYNFTIANDLPRIGYLTFMDFVLISTFVITAIVVILNVIFRRMEAQGKSDTLDKWDRILVWAYPLLYLVGGLVVTLFFFLPVNN